MTKKQSARDYNCSDPKMFESVKTTRDSFIDDKADFITFDPDFDDPFAADWLDNIEAGEALPSDETIEDQISQLTETVEEKMVSCRDKFQSSKYFIEKAFPDKPKVWNEFGYDDYDGARRVQANMIQFMKMFHGAATKYQVQLNANGYSDAKILEIKTLGDALDVANRAQESFIKSQPVLTQTRITAYNKVWEYEMKVCKAGKVIYRNNYAKYQEYLLPPDDESPEVIVISGIVSDSVSSIALQNVDVHIAALSITTTTNAAGKYVFGGLPDGDYSIEFTLAGYTPQTVSVTITDGAAVVRNVALVHV